MSITIKELPIAERPYEKLELYGEKVLSNAELLAIIIKTGTKEETSVQVAQRILKLNETPQKDDLHFLKQISIEEFMQIKGIGKVKAIQLKAICELAIRMMKPSNYKTIQIKSQQEIASMLLEELGYETKEVARVYLLDTKNYIIKIVDIAQGGTNFVNVSTKEIIAEAIKVKATKLILVHNHPSGDSTPSKQDIKFTDEVYNIATMCGIDVIDHIIIGKQEYTSVYSYINEKVSTIKNKKEGKKVIE